MICCERLPCESGWPRLMQRQQICRFGGSTYRRIALPCVSCSAAQVTPSAEPQAPPVPDHTQNGLLSLRQLVRTFSARSGDRRQGSSAANNTAAAAASPLLPAEVWESARLSRLAGLCYWPQQQLAERLNSEGIQLVAQGSTYFTSWYVCDADSRWAQTSAEQDAAGPRPLADSTTHAQPGPAAVRRRLVLLRGVTWSASDGFDAVRVWSMLARPSPASTACTKAQHIAAGMLPRNDAEQHHEPEGAAVQMRAWPTPFMERGTPEAGELLAHAGAAQMASELYDVLLPHLATAEPLHLTFAGSS